MTEIAKILSQEAWRLKNESRLDEALVLISLALEHNPDSYNDWNIKALILDGMGEYEKSLEFYDKAYELSEMRVILQNKARTLYRWARKLHFPQNEYEKALEVIDEAIEISPNEKEYWFLKGEILEGMGNLIDARKAYYMANGDDEKLDDLEYQLDLFEIYSDKRIINVTGTGFYRGLEPFAVGTVLDLVREPDNEHDPEAVRVDLEGETVGYVANSDFTAIEGVIRAGELKDTDSKAEVVMIYLNERVIAKLI